VAELLISERTARKIAGGHDLDVAEVRDAIVCMEGLQYVWDTDPERGERALVRVTIRGRIALVVLYEAAHPLGDTWNLGSAYFVD